jgi:hypothetical protein
MKYVPQNPDLEMQLCFLYFERNWDKTATATATEGQQWAKMMMMATRRRVGIWGEFGPLLEI